MATVFSVMKGALTMEFMQQENTITPEVHCETLKAAGGLSGKNTRNADIRYTAPPCVSAYSSSHSSTAATSQLGVV
jgi:hypothetical protein